MASGYSLNLYWWLNYEGSKRKNLALLHLCLCITSLCSALMFQLKPSSRERTDSIYLSSNILFPILLFSFMTLVHYLLICFFVAYLHKCYDPWEFVLLSDVYQSLGSTLLYRRGSVSILGWITESYSLGEEVIFHSMYKRYGVSFTK